MDKFSLSGRLSRQILIILCRREYYRVPRYLGIPTKEPIILIFLRAATNYTIFIFSDLVPILYE